MLKRMTYSDWREPARRLGQITGTATEELQRVASVLGCLHDGEPHGVLCAIVEDRLRPTLYGRISPMATEKQLAYLFHLGHSHIDPGMSRTVASAWINHYLAVESAQALVRLGLTSGDRVYVENDYVDPITGEVIGMRDEFTVSSIGANGLVYFRGGNGKCAWPAALSR